MALKLKYVKVNQICVQNVQIHILKKAIYLLMNAQIHVMMINMKTLLIDSVNNVIV